MVQPPARGRPIRTIATLAIAASSLLIAGCASAPGWYDAARARGHVEMLAGRIGPRPHGSPAAARARDYIAGELRAAGFDVRLQEADAVDAEAGLTARVVNVIGVRMGASPDAVALVSHYDSHPEAPGALDDALGVAVSIEAARQLATTPLTQSLFVIVTDAEEIGLMGARGVVLDPDVRSRVRAFLNFDGTGAAGSGLLFEAGPGWSAPLTAWASGAARPAGASFSTEIYRRLPNDTDFTVMKTIGASGLNFAPVRDSYGYHTDRDLPARVDDFTLRHEIVNAVSIVRALDGRIGASRSETPTWFAVFGRGVVYGALATRWLDILAIVAGLLAWVRLTLVGRRVGGVIGLVITAGWSLVSLAAVGGAMTGAVWLMRWIRAELNPWYASPHWFLLWIGVVGAAAAWAVGRVSAIAPVRWQPWRGPAAVWWLTLPIWIALTTTLIIVAPAGSYLGAWPLLVAAAGVALAAPHGWALRAASAAAFVVTTTLWLADAIRLLAFVVALFGWLPIVTPLVAYPAMLLIFGLMLAPPVVALLTRSASAAAGAPRLRWSPIAAVAALGVLAWAAPAYTWDRPHRRVVGYVQDDISRRAWWQIGGNEPGIDLGPGSPEATWADGAGAVPSSVPAGPINKPFRYRAAVQPFVATPPAQVTSRLTGDDASGWTLEVVIVPRTLTSARVVLPPGVSPLTSSLAGVVRGGRWMGAFAAVPVEGLTVRQTFGVLAGGRLDETAVVLGVAGVPDHNGAMTRPSWLSAATTAWTARSLHIVSARP